MKMVCHESLLRFYLKRSRYILFTGLILTLAASVFQYGYLDTDLHHKSRYDSETAFSSSNSAELKKKNEPNLLDNEPSLKRVWPKKAQSTDHGFQGAGVVLDVASLGERDRAIYTSGYVTHKVNQLASDMIPLRREIPLNIPECETLLEKHRDADLPTASLVIPMHNEMWSTLMRTIFSLLDAGPRRLINEIVVVDDASTNADLGVPLENYITIFGGKVKLLRLPERSGLIKARLHGCDHTTGDVIVILDAHCEVHKGWLEPLLHRIQQDDRVIAIPDINEINYDTYQVKFSNSSMVSVGGLTLDMVYSWQARAAAVGHTRHAVTDPIPTPTHLGCCLAVSRNNFERLGRYDRGLNIWGCENQELSFKAWMCGGRLEIIPCSHVAHLFRKSFPYTWGKESSLTHVRNCMRVAEVWMDEYKHFYYHRIGITPDRIDIGDISEQKALRSRLQCQSFHWYIKTAYPKLFVPLNSSAMGMISSEAFPNLCLQMESHNSGWNREPVMLPCRLGENRQYFILTRNGQIRRDEECLMHSRSTMHAINSSVVVKWCENIREGALWIYSKDGMIEFKDNSRSSGSNTRRHCLTLASNNSAVFMELCDNNRRDSRQKWRWPRTSIKI